MDHYAPTHDLTQPWRTRTMILSGIAVVQLVALVAIGVLVLGKGWFENARASAAAKHTTTHHASPATPPAKPAPRPRTVANAPTRPMVARARTGLLVLNGNGQSGAAGAEASTLKAHGYPVVAVGNARRNDYAASIVMYRPGYNREAERLAHDIGIRVVTGLDGVAPSALKSAKLLLIVGK
jgi:hypothetical protein